MSPLGHKRSLVRQTDWKSLDLAACSNALSTCLPLSAENEANDAFDLLEPSRIESATVEPPRNSNRPVSEVLSRQSTGNLAARKGGKEEWAHYGFER